MFTAILSFFSRMADLFTTIGVLIIIIGAFYTLYQFIKVLVGKGTQHIFKLEHLRIGIGCSITLGLDFMVAGDVIQTVVARDYHEMGLLASLVLIRIVLSFFLGKEIKSLRNGH